MGAPDGRPTARLEKLSLRRLTDASVSMLVVVVVSTAGAGQGYEVVVAGDGGISAEQLAALGVRPGSHLRVIVVEPPATASSFRGSLKGFSEPSW